MSITENIKTTVSLNIKNVIGWKTRRKIVVFSVDDYGNVRLHSKAARDKMFAAGLKPIVRYDVYDALETADDLTALYDTLSAVKDKNGQHAVFTAFTICANIDFEKMMDTGYSNYYYEELPVTFSKLQGYGNVWPLWKEGIQKRLLLPQFHGREHLNIKILMDNLHKKNNDFFISLSNRSYAAIGNLLPAEMDYTAAFDFQDAAENSNLKTVAAEGLDIFKKLFGYTATHFNPCGSFGYSHVLEPVLKNGGIKFIDTARFKKEHLGGDAYGPRVFNYTGKKNECGQTLLVRNCVFEPTEDRGIDWVSFCMKQIDAAFRWNQPAVISSHRVNFCGAIEPSNRQQGISSLKELLGKITRQWPDVEFMSANELGELISVSVIN